MDFHWLKFWGLAGGEMHAIVKTSGFACVRTNSAIVFWELLFPSLRLCWVHLKRLWFCQEISNYVHRTAHQPNRRPSDSQPDPVIFLNKNIKQFSLVEEARDGGARIVALKCSILVRSRCEACKPLPFWKALYLLITELDGPKTQVVWVQNDSNLFFCFFCTFGFNYGCNFSRSIKGRFWRSSPIK